MTKRLSFLPPLLIAVVLLSAAGCSEPAEAPQHGDMSPAKPSTAGQEDADFGLRLALLEGHLIVGRELVDAGQPQNAGPHFGHPVRELYGDISPVIDARHGVQFRNELVVLEATVGVQPGSETFKTRFAKVMSEIHDARVLIPAPVLASDDYTLRLVADIAMTASQEYRNAIIAGKIGSLVEYHDARGFIFYATQLLKERETSPNPKIRDAIATIARLRLIVSALNPPATPVASDAQFEAEAAHLREIIAAT